MTEIPPALAKTLAHENRCCSDLCSAAAVLIVTGVVRPLKFVRAASQIRPQTIRVSCAHEVLLFHCRISRSQENCWTKTILSVHEVDYSGLNIYRSPRFSERERERMLAQHARSEFVCAPCLISYIVPVYKVVFFG